MVLKGVMTLELTDENTGAVETVTEENMITEAVNNILGLNPMGIFYAATGEYDDALLWNGNLLPICPNMIGGILLFSETLVEDEVLTPETFEFLGSYTKYGEFLDGQDGYWYGFSNEGNSSGDALMLWIKISKTDYSFTEGQWTLSNAKLMDVGTRAFDSFAERSVKCCIRGGYLYVPANDKKGIYKISLSNSTDVTLIEFGFTSKWKPLCETGSCELYLTLIGDLIVGGDFQITAEDTVVHTQGSVRLNNAATPLFQYKNFLFGWGGSYGNEYRTAYLLTPYLASINNLSSAVVKTVDKTMKITYTLTEQPDPVP